MRRVGADAVGIGRMGKVSGVERPAFESGKEISENAVRS